MGGEELPVGSAASWAQTVQTKGRFLPLTSLLKVPSSFLATKMVVCERMVYAYSQLRRDRLDTARCTRDRDELGDQW